MTNLHNLKRREFLKYAALSAPVAIGGVPSPAQVPSLQTSGTWTYLGKNTRLSISMWDFSWLLAHCPGGAYQDLERRVAEAAERGYNTLRVDCFPSRILEAESAFHKNWTAGMNLPKWGEISADHTCNVRREVAHLADLCRKYGIWLGLDSWDKAHMFRSAKPAVAKTSGPPSYFDGSGPSIVTIAQADEERAFMAYGEIWAKALKLMREDGVLERAVWVAPMNEVPHFAGRSVESVVALRHQPKSEGETQLETAAELDAIYRRLNNYMGAPIKSEISRDGIPLSYSSLGAENYAARMSDIYDVVDIHFMPGVVTDAEDMGAFQKAGKGAPGGSFADYEKFDLKAFSSAWNDACRRHYSAMLERVSSYFTTALQHTTLASGKRLQAIITEPYGPLIWPDSPDVSWEWFKRYNADALRMIAAMDFTGASLSNYGEPLFTLWDDVGWHWAGNNFFRTASRSVLGTP